MTDYDRPYRSKTQAKRTVHIKENKKTGVLLTQMLAALSVILMLYAVKLIMPEGFQRLSELYRDIMSDNRTYEKAEETFNSLLKGEKENAAEDEKNIVEPEYMTEEDESFDIEPFTPDTMNVEKSEISVPTAVPLTSKLPEVLTMTKDFSSLPPDTCTYTPFKLNVPITVPVEGKVSSRFGYRNDPFTGEKTFHKGLDIAAKSGTEIKAAFSGTVVSSGTDNSLGKYVRIQHDNGLSTVYGHCSKLLVNEGDTVNAGDVIAEVGSTGRSTGPHLHFEIRINGIRYDPAYVLH